MANIRMISWNVQVFGPQKYARTPNNEGVIWVIARLIRRANANIVVLMELTSSVCEQICYSVNEAIQRQTGNNWTYRAIPCRPTGDREAYGIFWQTDTNFAVINDAHNVNNVGLSSLQFPNNFSAINGRRAAIANFRTTDTNVNFAVSVYHAPPNIRAIQGLEALAKSPRIYFVDNAGVVQNVPTRLLGGDYNLDITTVANYDWLEDPVPAPPPPTVVGEGAGTEPITLDETEVITLTSGVNRWGPFPAGWSGNAYDYLHLRLDNIFVSSNVVSNGRILDMVELIMNPADSIRAIVQNFHLTYPGTANPAFPNAGILPPPLNVNLSHASCAWLLYRYAISDHYPLLAITTI